MKDCFLLKKDYTIMNTIEEALRDLVSGKMIIVMDDEDRENEGDLIASAELCTPETVNFMSSYAKGLICMSITSERAKELNLDVMVRDNSALHETKFTVSVDYVHDTTTGISALDRAATIRAISNVGTKPSDLARPGHIFPLIAQEGGVLRRSGHTEATVDLMNLAGLKPSGVLCEIINEDGTMARLDDINIFAKEHDLKIITVKDLIKYRLEKESLIELVSTTKLNTVYGNFDLKIFRNIINGNEHLALVKGSWNQDEIILVRAHSEDLSSNIFGALMSKDDSKMVKALKMIENEGKGVLLLIHRTEDGLKISQKIKAHVSQEDVLNSSEITNKLGIQEDPRDYGIGAQILSKLGINKMKLITNSPKRRIGIDSFGIEIVENTPFI